MKSQLGITFTLKFSYTTSASRAKHIVGVDTTLICRKRRQLKRLAKHVNRHGHDIIRECPGLEKTIRATFPRSFRSTVSWDRDSVSLHGANVLHSVSAASERVYRAGKGTLVCGVPEGTDDPRGAPTEIRISLPGDIIARMDAQDEQDDHDDAFYG